MVFHNIDAKRETYIPHLQQNLSRLKSCVNYIECMENVLHIKFYTTSHQINVLVWMQYDTAFLRCELGQQL